MSKPPAKSKRTAGCTCPAAHNAGTVSTSAINTLLLIDLSSLELTDFIMILFLLDKPRILGSRLVF
jgi:hypothetical protein